MAGVGGLRSLGRLGIAVLVVLVHNRLPRVYTRLGRRAARMACLLVADLRWILLVEAGLCQVRIGHFLVLGDRRNSLCLVIGRALFECGRLPGV